VNTVNEWKMGNSSSRGEIDNWEIVQGIGTGTFGSVMAVKKLNVDEKDGEFHLYAMKCVDKREVLERRALLGTLTEMQIMARLEPHSFVLKLYYAFQDNRTLYLITDLCEGGSVDQLVRRKGALSEKAAVILFAELILAIEHLHKFGVIHMDIKLANLLLDITGHIKLADFNGSLKFKSATSEFTENSYFGTSGYLCPEVLIMEQGFIVSSPDWWGAGVCFWTMLHGKKSSPWQEKRSKFRSWEEELQVIVERRNPRIGSHVSAEASDIISKLLRLDWKLRLGCNKRGAEEIKSHKLFKKLDWDALFAREIEPLVRPQGAAFSKENSERTADKWVKDSLQGNLLDDPLTEAEQKLFKSWKYSIDIKNRPRFALVKKFQALNVKQARNWIAKASDDDVEQLMIDIRLMERKSNEDHREVSVSQNMVKMLQVENEKLKKMVRKISIEASRASSAEDLKLPTEAAAKEKESSELKKTPSIRVESLDGRSLLAQYHKKTERSENSIRTRSIKGRRRSPSLSLV